MAFFIVSSKLSCQLIFYHDHVTVVDKLVISSWLLKNRRRPTLAEKCLKVVRDDVIVMGPKVFLGHVECCSFV